jgi:hypothetical protein
VPGKGRILRVIAPGIAIVGDAADDRLAESLLPWLGHHHDWERA